MRGPLRLVLLAACAALPAGASAAPAFGAGAGCPVRPPLPAGTGTDIPAGRALTLCRYDRYPDLTAPTALVARTVIADARRVRRLTQALNALPVVPPGVAFSCPADFGGEISIATTPSPPFRAVAHTSGCTFLTVPAGPARWVHALLPRLLALTPERGTVTGKIYLAGGPYRRTQPPQAGTVYVLAAGGALVRRVHVPGGHGFRVTLAAGRYRLSLQRRPRSRSPLDCAPVSVAVTPRHTTRADVPYGCGIR